MIAKGTTHDSGGRLARYLVTGKEGERAELRELRGFASPDIVEAFRSIHVIAEATRAEKPFFHIQLRNPEAESLSGEQWDYAVNRIERMLGLTDQPRAVAVHIDNETGHEHVHVAWSRIDEETLTAKPLPFYKDRLKKISRELELHFGLTVVPNERDSTIHFAPTRAEDEQARRLGFDVHQMRQTIRDCYERSDCGRSFQAALEDEGLILAQGTRRDFVVIDHEGGMHALGKRILGVSAATIRDRLADISREQLPSIEQARDFAAESRGGREQIPQMPDPYEQESAWQDALAKSAIEKEKVARQFVEPREPKLGRGREGSPFAPPPSDLHSDMIQTHPKYWFGSVSKETGRDKRPRDAPAHLKGDIAHIWESYHRSEMVPAFVTALRERGIELAMVTKEEADRSYREAAFAREIGRYAPAYREGEVVAVSETAQVYRLNERATGEKRRDVDRFLVNLDRSTLPGIEVTKQQMHERAEARQAHAKLMSIVHPIVKSKRSPTGQTGRSGRNMPGKDTSLSLPSVLGKTAEKTLDFVGDAIASLLAPSYTPEQKQEIELNLQIRKLETNDTLDLSQQAIEKATARQAQEQQQRSQDNASERERDHRER